MDILELERLVIRGAASLGEGLHFYWPTANVNNEIHESNITIHFGRTLLDSNFFVFAEANPLGETAVRVDLLGLHPSSKVALICEFKRLYGPNGAKRMRADVARILSFQLQTGDQHVHERMDLSNFRKFGLVAATTWKKGYANWFSSTNVTAPHRTLSPLWASIPGPNKVCGAHPLSYGHNPNMSQAIQQWLLYAIFELP